MTCRKKTQLIIIIITSLLLLLVVEEREWHINKTLECVWLCMHSIAYALIKNIKIFLFSAAFPLSTIVCVVPFTNTHTQQGKNSCFFRKINKKIKLMHKYTRKKSYDETNTSKRHRDIQLEPLFEELYMILFLLFPAFFHSRLFCTYTSHYSGAFMLVLVAE